jgi:hypothetical protein
LAVQIDGVEGCASLRFDQGSEDKSLVPGTGGIVTTQCRALMTVLVVSAVAGSSASVSAKAQQLTEAFCKDALVQAKVEADARRQRLLSPPLKIDSVRFEAIFQRGRERFCMYTVLSSGERYDFLVALLPAQASKMRFRFEFMD